MDNRPIGIFDSGVGGLTAVRALKSAAPNESIIYFGDTARVPYGGRTKEEITNLSLQDVRFLRTYDLKAILIACNTITANCIEELREANPGIPILGVVESAAAAAVDATRNRRIGLIATQATVRSGVYETRLKQMLPGVSVCSQGCPKLVPLIESGHIHLGDAELEAVVAEYLSPLRAQQVDAVIMGCTHYPLIREVIQAYMGQAVTLIDSGGASAGAVLDMLRENKRLAKSETVGAQKYYCSARLLEFESIAETFLSENIHGRAFEIDIERF